MTTLSFRKRLWIKENPQIPPLGQNIVSLLWYNTMDIKYYSIKRTSAALAPRSVSNVPICVRKLSVIKYKMK